LGSRCCSSARRRRCGISCGCNLAYIPPVRRREILGIAAAIAVADKTTVARAEAQPLLVFAAASLKNALDEIHARWRRETGKRAMADPAAIPAGRYGKAALEKLGVWDTVASRIAAAENVRAALLLVARGEAPLGIVYRTDAAVEPNARIVDSFPRDTHPPIVYPIALTATSTNPDAPALLVYLRGAAAQAQFHNAGFTV